MNKTSLNLKQTNPKSRSHVLYMFDYQTAIVQSVLIDDDNISV